MVFDIGNLHVKGKEWKVGKGRSRSLLLKDGIGRGGKREGRRKGGEQPALTIKNRSRALTSKRQLGRPVKMLQTSWHLIGFAIRQTQSNCKFQSQEQSYQCQGQVAKANVRHPPRLLLSRPKQSI